MKHRKKWFALLAVCMAAALPVSACAADPSAASASPSASRAPVEAETPGAAGGRQGAGEQDLKSIPSNCAGGASIRGCAADFREIEMSTGDGRSRVYGPPGICSRSAAHTSGDDGGGA